MTLATTTININICSLIVINELQWHEMLIIKLPCEIFRNFSIDLHTILSVHCDVNLLPVLSGHQEQRSIFSRDDL